MPGSKGDTGPIGPPGRPGEKGDEVRGVFVIIHIYSYISMVILTDCIEGLHHVLLFANHTITISYRIFYLSCQGQRGKAGIDGANVSNDKF